jgi:hypothetical protein
MLLYEAASFSLLSASAATPWLIEDGLFLSTFDGALQFGFFLTYMQRAIPAQDLSHRKSRFETV